MDLQEILEENKPIPPEPEPPQVKNPCTVILRSSQDRCGVEAVAAVLRSCANGHTKTSQCCPRHFTSLVEGRLRCTTCRLDGFGIVYLRPISAEWYEE